MTFSVTVAPGELQRTIQVRYKELGLEKNAAHWLLFFYANEGTDSV
jgi:hypothetical protein